ncbi:hypothetical protein CDL12_18388 [Handroanthus impetiginosus]|uniref:DYW domain-containing protein n=1 Tax=Handroanthus impetiginosus TaxID=429701 RepID=A0A2G9GVJ3_9LAMI|nr:hypothetical protein CDL12_18388 [Handroanthus impetiginosus]
MICGYAKAGEYANCYGSFREYMRSVKGPDDYTLPVIIKACRNTMDLQIGRVLQGVVYKYGFDSNSFVAAALVDMYAKNKDIENARELFDEMPKKDLVSWIVMIEACTEYGNAEEVLDLFDRMRNEGVVPDKVAMIDEDYIRRMKFSLGVILGAALNDMHAKCGSIGLAREVFDKMRVTNVVSWSTMIAAHDYHWEGQKALDLFHTMVGTGILPNNITFVSFLYACSHFGLEEYRVTSDVKHFTCVVDLFGALLGACRIYGHVELAMKAAESLLELQPQNAGHYVLLSNIYAKADRWKEVAKVRELMTHQKIKKIPGWTWIEVDKKVHKFSVGDHKHPLSMEIHEELKKLREKLELAGYVPDTNFVLHDIDEELKLDLLHSHSEKLAIAFGLISTPEGTPISMTKNLRVCGVCHTFIKFLSLITKRVVVVRDANRFHHFDGGACSCSDYW